jgi:hypothetical protein
MARLGRLFNTLTQRNGAVAIGVTADVRRQGSTVTANQSGTTPFTITVDDPGGIRVADTVQVDGVGTSYNVSAIAVSSVTLNGFGGTLVLTNGQRLIPSNAKPTLYSDRQATNVLTPLRTNDFGEYEAFLDGGEYDIVTSGGGYGTRVFRDVYVASPRMVFNIFDNATAKAIILGVKNALATAGAKILSLQNPDGNEVVSFDKDGALSFTVQTANIANAAVTTVKIADANVTTAKIADGNVTTAKIAANAASKTYTGVGTADDAIVAAAYPTWTDVTNASVVMTPDSAASEIEVMVSLTFLKTGAAGTILYVSIRNAAGTVLREARHTDASATANTYIHVSLVYRVTGLAVGQTFKVSVNTGNANGTVQNSTNPQTGTTIVVVDHKK